MKQIKTNKWTITQDEEYWNNEWFDSKEEAIEAGKDYEYGYPHEDFLIGEIYALEFDENELDIADDIICDLSEFLYDYCGECSEDWYKNINKKQREDLNSRINKAVFQWIEDNNLQPECYTIDNIDCIEGDYECEEDS